MRKRIDKQNRQMAQLMKGQRTKRAETSAFVEDSEMEEAVRGAIEFYKSLEENIPKGSLADRGVRVVFADARNSDEPPESDPVAEVRAKLRADAPRALATLREIASTESAAGRKAKRYLERRGLIPPQTETLRDD